VHIQVSVTSSNALQEGPTVVTENLLSDANTRELLRNGFATRIHYRLELWRKGGWFDDRSGVTEWDILVQQDPTTHTYSAVRRLDGRVVETFAEASTVTTAEAQFGKAFKASLQTAAASPATYVDDGAAETAALPPDQLLTYWRETRAGDLAWMAHYMLPWMVSRIRPRADAPPRQAKRPLPGPPPGVPDSGHKPLVRPGSVG